MKLWKMRIKSKFNFLVITVIIYLALNICIMSDYKINKSMTNVYKSKVAVESELGMSIINERYPGEWNVKNGELYKGDVKINYSNDIFEEIGRITGGIANIFLENSTVATNIVVNGERRIGANANREIEEIVLKRGEVYVGEADISGETHLTMYQPVKDGNGQIIGMWLVGTPIEDIDNTIASILIIIFCTILFTAALAITVTVFFTGAIVRPINQVNEQLKNIAEGEGDLSKEIRVKSRDEIGDMATVFNKMLSTLRTMLSQVNSTSEQVAAASEELLASSEETTSATNQIASSVQEIAKIAEIQGKNTEESARAIGEINSGIQHIADSINTVAEAANETMNQASTGNEYIQKVVEQVRNIHDASNDTIEMMRKLANHSSTIGKIIDAITGISEQTNLLALNAAIEVARAGEQGRGFAVVADEVRKLADESRKSANQISEIIKLIQQDILLASDKASDTNSVAKNGLELAEETGKAFKEIVKAIENVNGQTQELSKTTEQLSASVELINQSIEVIAELAKTNSNNTTEIAAASEEQLATIEEITSSANTLANMAEELRLLVGRFKI